MGAINQVLRLRGGPPLESLRDLWKNSTQAVFTWPELDHYEGRVGHWGPVHSTSGKAVARWPVSKGPRVFVYLSALACASNPHRFQILDCLRTRGCSTLAYLPGVQDELPTHPLTTHLADPIDLLRVSQEAELVITNGGHNTAALGLQRGVPLLFLPFTLEQGLFGYRLQNRGLAVSLNWFNPQPDLGMHLERGLNLQPPALPQPRPLLERVQALRDMILL